MTTPEFEINRNILSGNTADYEIIRTGEFYEKKKSIQMLLLILLSSKKVFYVA